jgi:hypothetical protein
MFLLNFQQFTLTSIFHSAVSFLGYINSTVRYNFVEDLDTRGKYKILLKMAII